MNVPPLVLADPAFVRCIQEAASNPQLLAQYARLKGTSLVPAGAPIDVAIDAATGRPEAEARGLAEFVFDVVYSRVGQDVLEQLRAGACA